MAFIPLVNGAQVEVRYIWLGQHVENRWFILFPSAPSASDIQDAATDFDTWAQDDLMPLMTNQISYIETVCTDWTTDTGFQYTFTPTSPVPGAVDASSVPSQAAILISERTGFRGRSQRGRTYLPGGRTDVLTLGKWTDVYVALVDAAMVAIPGLGDTTPYALVVASFFSGVDVDHKPIPRDTGVATPINTMLVDNVPRSQRRREIGVGI